MQPIGPNGAPSNQLAANATASGCSRRQLFTAAALGIVSNRQAIQPPVVRPQEIDAAG